MDALQLDRAEFETAQAAACARCGEPLKESYFQVNGAPHCGSCCEIAKGSLAGGSSFRRAARAFGAGLAAALAGSLLYLAILWGTGYEFGLIAIVVGYGVGRAVSWGSNGRGGWRYQTMAMVLTYMAIVSAFVPLMISNAWEESDTEAAERAGTKPTGSTATAASSVDSGEPSLKNEPVSIGRLIAWIVMVFAIAAAVPFLQGASNIIGIVIIGIGLYEAWKLNKRQVLEITGPHAIGSVAEPIAAS